MNVSENSVRNTEIGVRLCACVVCGIGNQDRRKGFPNFREHFFMID